jgi:putative ABC transport system permease protein
MLPEGQPAVPLAQRPFLDVEAVSPGWFRTLEVPLLAGREFTDADDAEAPKVTIVNEAFARRFWPGENPLGKTVTIGRWTQPAQVVGVTQDVHNRGLAAAPQAQIYLPFAQLPWGDMNLLVRTAVAPLSLAPAVEAQVSAVDPDQPVTDVHALGDLMDTDRAQPRLTMLLLAAFSATALLLAAIGLAAMLAWSTVQRRQELAIRLALGAERRDLMWLVVSQGLTLAGTGIAVGLAAGLALTRLMSSVLYRTSAHDLRTFVLAPLVLLGVAGAASLIPARRALRVDPIESLRG